MACLPIVYMLRQAPASPFLLAMKRSCKSALQEGDITLQIQGYEEAVPEQAGYNLLSRALPPHCLQLVDHPFGPRALRPG